MRAALIAALIGFSLAACKPNGGPNAVENPPLRSVVEMGDSQSAAQLVSGFHQVENNAWRWTERQFAVTLATPRPAPNGATLALKLTVPPAITNALQTIALSASIAGSVLAPESYAAPGGYTYQRDVAPDLLAGESVRVNFRLDKAVPPSGADLRELGIIVQSVGLIAK